MGVTAPFAPWRGGVGGVRMGLAPIEPAEWLVRTCDHDARLAEKRALFDREPARVYGSDERPATRAAVDELCELLGEYLTSRTGWTVDASLPPLVNAAFNVDEDLCVLLPEQEDHRLVAAAVFAPSYWRLAEKLGEPLQRVHAPVVQLEERIGARIRQLLARLDPARVLMRGNWHVHTGAERFHPASDDWSRAQFDESNVGERLFVRTERQTLRKLPQSGAVVFTILVHVHRLDELAADRVLVEDLLNAFENMPEIERAERHFDIVGAPLRGWLVRLRNQTGASAGAAR